MNPASKRNLSALLAGLIFGVGLLLSGMTQPEKVLGFLDIFGDWDPSLLCVMAGAIAVHMSFYLRLKRWTKPLAAHTFSLPPTSVIDRDLIAGAAIFGVGWGLSGYCPGPSIVSVAGAVSSALFFVPALLVGTLVVTYVRHKQQSRTVAECG
jgi:uncharacterized membrane protein YedE/YeeE